MKMKKVSALLMAAVLLVTTLGGCGSSNNGNTEATNGNTSTEQSDPAKDVNESGSEQEDSTNIVYDFSDREHYTIKIMMFGEASTEACNQVAEELSKITEEKLNADVELVRVGFGSYDTQLNLALSSGEELDLFSPFTLGLNTLANNGQIQPMDELLETYGAEMYAQISESDWACMKVGDEIFGIPNNRDKASSLGFMMRKDILDEIEVSVEEIGSFEDLHDVLVKVKEAFPDMYPAVPDFSSMMGILEPEYINGGLAVLLDPFSDDLTLVNLYESDYFRELCEMMFSWAQEGLIMPDASANSESGNSLIASGKAFGRFSHMKPGFDEENTTTIGREITSWVYREALSGTVLVALGWSIGQNSGDPERAMALLNLMYTDSEVANLVVNGIEGVNYQILDEEKGIIDYPEGESATTSSYARLAWGWPNQQITYVWNGDSETVWEELDAFNNTAAQSPAKGFSFDNASVINESAACSNVVSKYSDALLAGALDPSETLPQFISELKAAGSDVILEEVQRQLDAWAEVNK